MKMLKINSLGSQNVNFDLEPCDLPAEVFTYGTNYKLVNNKIVSFNMSKTLRIGFFERMKRKRCKRTS